MFERELEYFIANQERLVQEHSGRILVIKDQEVLGVYDTQLEAYCEAQKEHQLGTFMIQPCAPGPDAYTVTISPAFQTMIASQSVLQRDWDHLEEDAAWADL